MSKIQSYEWVCGVKVATVWTNPESVREIDTPGIANPVQMMEWLEALPYKERLALCDDNRVQTQLLYGEPVLIDEVQGDWAKVIAVWQPSKKDTRGYPGWVPLSQLKRVTLVDAIGIGRIADNKAQIFYPNEAPFLVVPFNTILPVVEERELYYVVQTPEGQALVYKKQMQFAESVELLPKLPVEKAVDLGVEFLDLPYFWGGMSSYGYDCSGFTYNMMKAIGHFIPRDAGDQALGGIEVSIEDPDQWRKGDLLFFATKGTNRVRHVGFYYGNGQLLHSPSTGKATEILLLKGSKLEEEICAVRRYTV